jgi:hypothetical protein
MNYVLIFGLTMGLAAIGTCCWLGWQLLQQNGRMLLRIEAVEKQLGEKAESRRQKAEIAQEHAEDREGKTEVDESLVTSAPTGDEDGRAERFSSRSLANSKIKRDGLKAGTVAPEFRLPRLDGGELSLS